VGAPEPLAFLDGIQRSEVVAYAGSAPLLVATVAAGVCERRDRRLRTVVRLQRRLLLGRPAALAVVGDAASDLDLVPLADDEPPHPVRDLLNAARILDRERGSLEILAGDTYRKNSDSWLLVDGALSDSPRWASDSRMVGISKSHSVLPLGVSISSDS
jgi:hypothetical protein